MKSKGFYNEIDFINALNKKCIGKLNKTFKAMLNKLYKKELKEKDIILCQKSFKTDKTDIIITINNVKKYISIKSGKNNSIHLEHISEFEKFLKKNKISENYINIYKKYHYATNKNGTRINAKEYQEQHKKEINKFNNIINSENIATKLIERFVFKGTHYYNNKIDGIIYGTINNFVYLSREEIQAYLLRQKDIFYSIHVSSLVLQPWTRNLNYNPKYENRRDYIQVKWYRIEKILDKIAQN